MRPHDGASRFEERRGPSPAHGRVEAGHQGADGPFTRRDVVVAVDAHDHQMFELHTQVTLAMLDILVLLLTENHHSEPLVALRSLPRPRTCFQ